MAALRGLIIFCLLSTVVKAQTNDRYFVFFKDKTGTPYSVNNPSAFLSPRSIARRNHSNVAVTTADLPVTPAYVSAVKSTGAKTYFTSRWRNGVLVEASSSQITTITGLSFVSGIEKVAPGTKLIGGRIKQIKQKNVTATAEVTDNQLKMLGIDKMHADGFHGEGIIIAILDDGFTGVNSAAPFNPVFANGKILATKDFITNSSNVYQFDDHGTEVFSIIAAQIQSAFMPGADGSNYLLFVTEDNSSEYRIEEYNWLFGAEKADSVGADIIQSSLGYSTFDDSQMDYTLANLNGTTTVVAKAAGMARDRAIIVVVSAGNEGAKAWHYITTPADTDGILAVGAVSSSGAKASFSSFGPSADGRIKPDVSAMGQNVSVVAPDGSLSIGSGTSFSSPLVASLVAGLLQAYPQFAPSALIDIIKKTSSQAVKPDNALGFGIPNYVAVKNYLNAVQLTDKVQIYPNPVTTTLNLAFKELPSGSIELTLFDALGKQMNDQITDLDWESNPIAVSVSGLAPGCYFLKVKTSTLQTTLRFVKI